jgi:hypothetical protein
LISLFFPRVKKQKKTSWLKGAFELLCKPWYKEKKVGGALENWNGGGDKEG